jgi:hypothetical protein
MISFRSHTNPQAARNVSAWDRAMLLRRLASLTDAHDNLIANDLHGSDEAAKIRRECVRCLRRLGVSQAQINKLTSARGPLPEYAEIERGEADAAQPHDEGE